MAKLTGFMDYARKTSTDVPPLERIENFNEFHIWLSRDAAMGTAPAEVIVCDTVAGGIPDFHLPQEKRPFQPPFLAHSWQIGRAHV